jgi:hypothetical protein
MTSPPAAAPPSASAKVRGRRCGGKNTFVHNFTALAFAAHCSDMRPIAFEAPVNRMVAGSNPARGAKQIKDLFTKFRK